jgi:hypothetical protein
MEQEPITNREIVTLINTNLEKNELQHKAIMDSLSHFHETTKIILDEIKEQTTKTNGTVKGLTKEVDNLRLWRSGIVACIALLGFIIPLVITAIK